MKVFLSWSQERSRLVALALRDWLPLVLQNVTLWMSGKDVSAGARWGQELDTQLADCDFGILVLTRENPDEPWLLYEAGALAKSISASSVVPYLVDLEPSDLPAKSPLTRFQAKRANESETLEMVLAINEALGPQGRPTAQARQLFEKLWPELEAQLRAVPAPGPAVAKRSVDVVAADTLERVQQLARDVAELQGTLLQTLESLSGVKPRLIELPAVREDALRDLGRKLRAKLEASSELDSIIGVLVDSDSVAVGIGLQSGSVWYNFKLPDDASARPAAELVQLLAGPISQHIRERKAAQISAG